jgi:glyoxylase-like metal-dependent hydrolase (beta-lactamase superfamily II)
MMHGPTTHPNVANKGFMNNVGLIVSKKSLIVLDPGSTKYVGEMVLKEIEKISKKPIVAVFDSHVHGDHWLANNAIKNKYPNVKIYGSKNMITKIKNGEGKKWIKTMHTLTKGLSDGTKVVAPNINVKDMQKIKIDNETFLIHIPIKLSHTSTDILVEHINTKTLFLGDNALVDRLGRFEADSSIYGNIEVLKYALKLKVAYSVPSWNEW